MGGGGFFFGGSIATTAVAPVNFVDFAGGGASRGSFKIARERKHGDVAGFLIEADDHDAIGELGSIVSAVAFVAFHVVTTGAESENIGATVGVGLERLVGRFGKSEEVKNVALAAGDFGDDVVAPDNKTDAAGDEEQKDNDYNSGDDFAFFGHRFFSLFRFFHRFGVVNGSGRSLEFAAFFVKIKNFGRGEEIGVNFGFGFGLWNWRWLSNLNFELGWFGGSGFSGTSRFDGRLADGLGGFGSSGCFGSFFGSRFSSRRFLRATRS